MINKDRNTIRKQKARLFYEEINPIVIFINIMFNPFAAGVYAETVEKEK